MSFMYVAGQNFRKWRAKRDSSSQYIARSAADGHGSKHAESRHNAQRQQRANAGCSGRCSHSCLQFLYCYSRFCSPTILKHTFIAVCICAFCFFLCQVPLGTFGIKGRSFDLSITTRCIWMICILKILICFVLDKP